MAEGVGFEPTVGCPTLDFESSALNRTQPPFPPGKKERRTLNVQHPTSNANAIREDERDADNPRRFVSDRRLVAGESLCCLSPISWQTGLSALRPKNVTILGLPSALSVLHLVCPHGQPRYYLLLTDIHRFLAPLFTSIPNLFRT